MSKLERLKAEYKAREEEFKAERTCTFRDPVTGEERGFSLGPKELDLLNRMGKEEARIKKLKKSLIFLGILIVGFALFVGIRKLVTFIQGNSASNELTVLSNGFSFDHDEYINGLKNTPSDIKGMSKYDKLEMGLKMDDNSDSDYDGLSDKEEIEKYHSNPLMTSTAGDLYRDGYKVKNGMDLFTAYEYTKKIETKYIDCPEISIEVKSPTDFYTVASDVTNRYNLDSFGMVDIYKGYEFYNYTGKVTIDVSEIMQKKKIEPSDMDVFIFTGSFIIDDVTECKEVDFEVNGSSITPNFEFDNTKSYFIYIGKKGSFLYSAQHFLGSLITDKKSTSFKSSESKGSVLYMGNSIIAGLGGNTFDIYYTEGDEDILEDALAFYKRCFLSGRTVDPKDNPRVHAVSREQYKQLVALYNTGNNIFWLDDLRNFTWASHNFHYLLYVVYEFDGTKYHESNEYIYEGKEEADEKEEVVEEKAPFNFEIDELPFQNFGSSISAGGNCAGISHFTSYLYNNGYYPGKGKYKDIKWNIKKDADNETLLDPGLSDYKDERFIYDNLDYDTYVLKEDYLSDSENEFVRMIGAAWAEANSHVSGSDIYVEGGQTIPYSTIKHVMKYMDGGKIVEAGIYLASGGFHAINLYNYRQVYDNMIVFDVYDSNIPQNRSTYEALRYEGRLLLMCSIKTDEDGKKYVQYNYRPFNDRSSMYFATNNTEYMPDNGILFWDEEWNVFK